VLAAATATRAAMMKNWNIDEKEMDFKYSVALNIQIFQVTYLHVGEVVDCLKQLGD